MSITLFPKLFCSHWLAARPWEWRQLLLALIVLRCLLTFVPPQTPLAHEQCSSSSLYSCTHWLRWAPQQWDQLSQTNKQTRMRLMPSLLLNLNNFGLSLHLASHPSVCAGNRRRIRPRSSTGLLCIEFLVHLEDFWFNWTPRHSATSNANRLVSNENERFCALLLYLYV